MPTQLKLEPIVPKRKDFPVNLYSNMEKYLSTAMNGVIRQRIEGSLYLRTVLWTHRITFKSTFNTRASALGLTGVSLVTVPFGTNKRFWVYVSAGVKGHPISPKRKNLLRIRGGVGGYLPHTKPGNYKGGPGKYNDSATFYAKYIRQWPGIEPRDYEKYVVDENRVFIVKTITAAIDRALA